MPFLFRCSLCGLALSALAAGMFLFAPAAPAAVKTVTQSDASSRERNIDELKRFSQVLNIVERYYVNEADRAKLIDGALKGMLQGLDPHSTLMNKEEYKEMRETTSGEFFGVGIEITLDGNQVTVVSPIEDTPAYRAGVKPGDVILSIDGQPTLDMSLQDVVSRIRGPKDTEVEIMFMQKEAQKPVTLKIKRDAIPLISVKARELEDGYYWVRLTRFSERTTTELLEALKDVNKDGKLKGIVLDLRNNPGGLLDQAVKVADVFLKEGQIVSMRGRDPQSNQEFNATAQPTDVTVPLVVLVNAGSASAAEIVAGALGDQKRAMLIGERTFGKGSVQHIIALADGSGVKLTVALYYTPSGRSIQAEGIEPDIVVPFELPREEKTPSFSLREQDLRRHLEVNNKDDAKKDDKKADEAKDFLERDNQLRMALQLVKSLPRLRQIH